MDLSRGRALNAVTNAAEQMADADDELHRTEDREREQTDREDEFDQVKQTLDDAEAADTSKGRDLDGDRVGEIRSLLAEGGDKAVVKKFGESALASPEAAKAKVQQTAIRKHERDMAITGLDDAANNDRKQTARTEEKRRPSMREQAMERYLESERETGSLSR